MTSDGEPIALPNSVTTHPPTKPGNSSRVHPAPEVGPVKTYKSAKDYDEECELDGEELKAKVRESIAKPVYNVTDYYHRKGVCQAIARHRYFEQTTAVVIFANAVYIGIDTDYNTASNLVEADIGWKIMENLFCIYFFLELLVRFLSFKSKLNCLKDAWFIFDGVLVTLMVIDAWIMSIVISVSSGTGSSGLGKSSILRLFRLLRLARMARMLRSIPEVMVLIKGMMTALRSVFFVMCLLILVLYSFGVAMSQLLQGTVSGEVFFPTVLFSMYTLVCSGIFCDELTQVTSAVMLDSYPALALFFIFMVIGLLTILNLLVGILCDVVDTVADKEKDYIRACFASEKVRYLMSKVDTNHDGEISKDEFLRILEIPEAAQLFDELDVDAVGLVDLADFIFDNYPGEGVGIPFDYFMEIVMKLRGSNQATVRDTVDLHKLIATQIAQLDSKMLHLCKLEGKPQRLS